MAFQTLPNVQVAAEKKRFGAEALRQQKLEDLPDTSSSWAFGDHWWEGRYFRWRIFGSIQQKFWMQCVLDPTMIRIGSARRQFGGGFWYVVSGVQVGTLQDSPKRLLFFWSGDDGSNGEKNPSIIIYTSFFHILSVVFFFLNWKPLKWLMSPKKTKAAPYNLWWNIWRTSPFLGFSNSRWRQLCCHGRHLLCLDLRFGKCFFWQEGRDEETSFDTKVHGECYEQKESHRWHGWQLNKPFCSDWSSLEFIFEVVEPGSFN